MGIEENNRKMGEEADFFIKKKISLLLLISGNVQEEEADQKMPLEAAERNGVRRRNYPSDGGGYKGVADFVLLRSTGRGKH